jgi:hypothetical protein
MVQEICSEKEAVFILYSLSRTATCRVEDISSDLLTPEKKQKNLKASV